jgi:acetoin utilization deacetylase AcuC-like enzyme
MGFCLFANAAITARYLQKKYHLSKIGIVDFDVHHGNGTQAFVSDDPTIFFASIHQHPRISYPGSGFEWDIGMGKGRGYTLNIPLEAHLGDGEYLRVMDERVIPQLDEFAPEALILSAGFDAHRDDPLAGEEVSELGFELMTRSLCAVADRHCGGRVISLLEGGYDLVALGRSVVSHIRGLQG